MRRKKRRPKGKGAPARVAESAAVLAGLRAGLALRPGPAVDAAAGAVLEGRGAVETVGRGAKGRRERLHDRQAGLLDLHLVGAAAGRARVRVRPTPRVPRQCRAVTGSRGCPGCLLGLSTRFYQDR